MKIKATSQERRKIDIREWNDEVAAYIRPLNGFEQLIFNDSFLVFYDKDRSFEERLKAGFEAAKMALVMEDNAPLLTDDDAETMKNASVVPFYRLFNMQFSGGGEIETAKKN